MINQVIEMESNLYPVETKGELIKLISSLASNARNNPCQWENNDLPSFLQAMTSWMEDMDGFYENMNKPCLDNACWGVFADILMAARLYE